MIALGILVGFIVGAQVLWIANLMVSARQIGGAEELFRRAPFRAFFGWPDLLIKAFIPDPETEQHFADAVHVFGLDEKVESHLEAMRATDIQAEFQDTDTEFGSHYSVHTIREVMTARYEQGWNGLPDWACFTIKNGVARIEHDGDFEVAIDSSMPKVSHLKPPEEQLKKES